MLCMVSYSRRPQSGQITCYLNRTYHVLPTQLKVNLCNFEQKVYTNSPRTVQTVSPASVRVPPVTAGDRTHV